jgi:hypothetical protein
MKEVASSYTFFENNQRLTESSFLTKGNHFVHFKGSLKGGMWEPERIFVYLSTADEIIK